VRKERKGGGCLSEEGGGGGGRGKYSYSLAALVVESKEKGKKGEGTIFLYGEKKRGKKNGGAARRGQGNLLPKEGPLLPRKATVFSA